MGSWRVWQFLHLVVGCNFTIYMCIFFFKFRLFKFLDHVTGESAKRSLAHLKLLRPLFPHLPGEVQQSKNIRIPKGVFSSVSLCTVQTLEKPQLYLGFLSSKPQQWRRRSELQTRPFSKIRSFRSKDITASDLRHLFIWSDAATACRPVCPTRLSLAPSPRLGFLWFLNHRKLLSSFYF